MKRLINPMEMVRSLTRGEVRRSEVVFYTILFLSMLSFSLYLDFTPQRPTVYLFPWGDWAVTLLGNISTFIYFVFPAIIAWKKMSIGMYLKYFVSIGAPITILTLIATIILGLATLPPERITIEVIQVSLTQFLFITLIIFLSSIGMPYFMKKATHLLRQ